MVAAGARERVGKKSVACRYTEEAKSAGLGDGCGEGQQREFTVITSRFQAFPTQ